jgi:S1-C subfamily serine protease
MKAKCSAILLFFVLAVLSVPTYGNELVPAELQTSVQAAIQKVMPATVAILEGGRRRVSSAFSGVIVSPEGHVLTAGHAVEPGARYRVVLSDGRRVSGEGLGRELEADCGMIRITDSGPWPHAEMGWSASLQKDQPCLSLGFPGLFNGERGAVARFGRIAEPLSRVKGFIQSTCLMEPGDSGGPLFDLNGRIIGIHSMVFQSLENNYEVPIDQFRRYWVELNQADTFDANEVVRAPRFGIQFAGSGRDSRNDGSNWSFARRGRRGVRVSAVLEGSVAATAGLKEGDRIVAINGRRVRTPSETHTVLYRCFVLQQEAAELELARDGDRLAVSLNMPLSEMDEHQKTLSMPPSVPPNAPADSPWLQPLPELQNLVDCFEEMESRLDDLTATVTSSINGEARKSVATIVRHSMDADNAASESEPHTLLVSKSSLVGTNVRVTFDDGQVAVADVVARDRDRDLVLIRVADASRPGITWSESTDPTLIDLSRGKLLLTPQPRGPGIASILGSATFDAAKRESTGFLGVMPGQAENNRVVLNEIIPDGAANKANFLKGDIITHINDVLIGAPSEMISELQNYFAGDRVRLRGWRADQELDVEVVLGVRPENSDHAADMFKSGKSQRRDGFPAVVTHDAKLEPADCGGPLFDLNETFIGLNIARFSRSRSYAIPAEEIRQFVSESLSAEKAPAGSGS